MTPGQVAVLGVVQSVTEFLPVSSDGHLTLFQVRLGLSETSLGLQVALHLGTLGSILVFFGKDLLRMVSRALSGTESPDRALEKRRLLYLVAATIPTALVGWTLKSTVEEMGPSFSAAGGGFLLTALFLAAGERAFSRARLALDQTPLWNAALLGLIQGAAVWPGLSRSGSTIATALVLGWRWEEAGRFSFLMAIPAILGAAVLTAGDMANLNPTVLLTGLAVSFLGGCVSLYILMKFLAAKCLWPFAVYCALLGAWTLFRVP